MIFELILISDDVVKCGAAAHVTFNKTSLCHVVKIVTAGCRHCRHCRHCRLTVLVVTGQIFSVNKQIVVLVQLPELAVYHIEVLVAEEVGHLIDVIFILKQLQS